jgi:hypothetical protein
MASSWESFFVAQVGSSAALTGLVFVALSINLGQIVQEPMLVGRALEAVTVLVSPVIVGLAVLVPEVSLRTTGILVGFAALTASFVVNRLIVNNRASARERPLVEFRTRVVLAQLATLPAIVGAVILISGSDSGLYGIALGAAMGIVVGIIDGWVLLVEILR